MNRIFANNSVQSEHSGDTFVGYAATKTNNCFTSLSSWPVAGFCLIRIYTHVPRRSDEKPGEFMVYTQ